MNGKGDRNRTSNWDAFYEGYNNVFRPKEPFYNDVQEYESRFRGGNIDSTKVSVAESLPSDVGANPTSSTIETTPFKADPIKHDKRRNF